MRPTILVVDDNQLYRTAFCGLLQLCWPDAQIIEAADASQALAVFPDFVWSLIILDYQLPTLSGTDLARHLRNRVQAHGQALPPLVLMSTQPDAATFARAMGALMFLPKPVEADVLRLALEPLLSPTSARQPLAPPPARPLVTAPALPTRSVQTSTRIVQLQIGIQKLVQQTLQRFPAPHAPGTPAPQIAAGRLGDALVRRGYLTRWQLLCALQTNRLLPPHQRVPLGFTVAAQHNVPVPVLAAMLLHQFRERLSAEAGNAARFIGEQWLLYADLAPEQLALALQLQVEGYQQGHWVRLGDLLVRQGWRAPVLPSAAAPVGLQRD
jgi:CheY-like chemotaxis protein